MNKDTQQLGMDEGAAPLDYFDDIDVQRAESSEDSLKVLTRLAKEYVRLSDEIADDETALGIKKAAFEKLTKVRIPEIMDGLDMKEFKLVDGSKIEVRPDLKASITEANKAAAHAWLRENNFDGIIKTSVSQTFGKGETAESDKLRELLNENGYFPEVSEGVHNATLKAFVKEQMAEGTAIPQDLFGVYDFKIAKISLPKVAKPRKK